MTSGNGIGRIAIGACLLAFGAAAAQDTANDQAEVWSVIERQWESDEEGDDDWAEEMLTENFSGWQKNAPAPRNKSSTRMWDDFQNRQGKVLEHELYPLAIVIDKDTAVAHYLYTSAFESKDGEIEVANGRFTDILVRTEDGWKFLAWHGGDD